MIEDLPEVLDALADDDTAQRTARQLSCLRGIRGVSTGELARVCAEVWQAHPSALPRDAEALSAAFGTAWEDGLVAIGLLAAAVTDDPEIAAQLGLDWAERTDDVVTADALGWLVLAPAAQLSGRVPAIVSRLREHPRPASRRVAVSMGLGFTTAAVEGPAAAALREKVGRPRVRMVDEPRSDLLALLSSRFVRDGDPSVQKALRRVLRAWGQGAPADLVAWGEAFPGGLPRMLRDEILRASKRAGAR